MSGTSTTPQHEILLTTTVTTPAVLLALVNAHQDDKAGPHDLRDHKARIVVRQQIKEVSIDENFEAKIPLTAAMGNVCKLTFSIPSRALERLQGISLVCLEVPVAPGVFERLTCGFTPKHSDLTLAQDFVFGANNERKFPIVTVSLDLTLGDGVRGFVTGMSTGSHLVLKFSEAFELDCVSLSYELIQHPTWVFIP